MKSYYLAGPSKEILIKKEGESNIEILFDKLKKLGVPPIYNWAADIRKFNKLEFPNELERKQSHALYMRNDYNYIEKADLVIFAMLDAIPSIGMQMEAGLTTYLNKPVMFYLPKNYYIPSLLNQKFMSHEFFILSKTKIVRGEPEDLSKLLI